MFGDVIASFSQQHVLILGDVILDEYIFGEVKRISPEAPIPVVETRRREYRAGGASNVAVNVASLGGAPLLCGVVGGDTAAVQLGDVLNERLAEGRAHLVPSTDRPTSLKSRVIAHSQQMLRLDTEATRPVPGEVEDAILAWVEAQLATVQACVLSDYAKGVLTDRVCREVIRLATRRDLPVIIDPKGTRYERYAGATIITPNRNEAIVATNRPINAPEDLELAARELLALLDGANLLITRGEEGMSLFRQQQAPVHFPAQARTVFDVTGAGDTVVGTLALAMATGMPLEQAVMLANLAASIVVGKLGTSSVTGEELLRTYHEMDEPVLAR